MDVFRAMILAWIAKTLYEILATPLTYLVVGWLKAHRTHGRIRCATLYESVWYLRRRPGDKRQRG